MNLDIFGGDSANVSGDLTNLSLQAELANGLAISSGLLRSSRGSQFDLKKDKKY